VVECLECGAEVTMPDDVKVGDEIACRTCGELFVVVELDPIEIDYPDDDDWDWGNEKTEEDWNDEEDEDETDDAQPAGDPPAVAR
jgi:alpha-aminoadipate carrier protein LysW